MIRQVLNLLPPDPKQHCRIGLVRFKPEAEERLGIRSLRLLKFPVIGKTLSFERWEATQP